MWNGPPGSPRSPKHSKLSPPTSPRSPRPAAVVSVATPRPSPLNSPRLPRPAVQPRSESPRSERAFVASPRAPRHAQPSLAPPIEDTTHSRRVTTFYKLTAKDTIFPMNAPMGGWEGIQSEGLDPRQAAVNPLGATSSAKGQTGRPEAPLDRNQTWLAATEEVAAFYKSHIKSGRMLRIDVPEDFSKLHIVDRGSGNFTTSVLIPPGQISVKTRRARRGQAAEFTPIAHVTKAHLAGYSTDSDAESDSE